MVGNTTHAHIHIDIERISICKLLFVSHAIVDLHNALCESTLDGVGHKLYIYDSSIKLVINRCLYVTFSLCATKIYTFHSSVKFSNRNAINFCH